ncbi:MAG: tetraacyldisaccharide 4'-kinase [Candidatus Melainabacteria bacterium]
MKAFFARQHQQPTRGWVTLLKPLSWVYGLTVRLRLTAYQRGWLASHRVGVPVISVGNLTTGGTGKTPIIMALADSLVRAGVRVVILSRGYGAKVRTRYARAIHPDFGDEACWIQQQVPEAVVIVGADRVHTAQRAITDFSPDLILLDDGFQHLRLQRDLDIVLVDGALRFGNNALLPAGPLREPLSGLGRASLVLLTKNASPETLHWMETLKARYGPACPILPVLFRPHSLISVSGSAHHTTVLPEDRAVVFSGIANPSLFEANLQELGILVDEPIRFEDHHIYTQADVSRLLHRGNTLAENNNRTIFITTDKDWVKLRHLFPTELHNMMYTLQTKPLLDVPWFLGEFILPLLQHPTASLVHQSTGASEARP